MIRFLVIFFIFVGAAQAQEQQIAETLELLSQEHGESPSAKAWNAYVKLEEDPRDLSSELRELVVGSESLAVSSMALELMRKRGELQESDIQTIKDYTRRSYSNLLSHEDGYGNDRLEDANKVFAGLRALTSFEGSKFEEDFIIEFIFSEERLVRGKAANILSKHGSEKSAQALQNALDQIPEDARYRAQLVGSLQLLEERLEIESHESPYAVKTPSTPPDSQIEEDAQESTAPEPAIEEPAEVATSELSSEPIEQSSNWWLWLIGALVVVGGLVVVVRRKS